MLRRFVLLAVFVSLAPMILGLSFVLLSLVPSWRLDTQVVAGDKMSGNYQLFGSLPAVKGAYTVQIDSRDARAKLIERFLDKYNSPMTPHPNLAQYIVQLVDKNNFPRNLDFLLVAIAMCESNLGKKVPEGTHNPLGWGIHSRGTLGFESWQEAFAAAASGLGKNYIGQGRVSPEKIMTRYTPHSDGSWSRCVNHYIAEIEEGE